MVGSIMRDIQNATQKIERKVMSGIVVDNMDPLKMQRVRVRVHDLHRDILDRDIPWALKKNNNSCYGQSNGGTGETGVPPIGSKVYITWQTDDLYFPMWDGAPATLDVGSVAEFEPYPNCYGSVDWAGNIWKIECTEGNVTALFKHVSGTQLFVNHFGDIFVRGARDMFYDIARDIGIKAGRNITMEALGNITQRSLNWTADASLNARLTAGIGMTISGDVSASMIGGVTATLSGGVTANMTGGLLAKVSGGTNAILSGGVSSNVSGGVTAQLVGGVEADVSAVAIRLASELVLANDITAPAGPQIPPVTPGTPSIPNIPTEPTDPVPVEPRVRPVILFIPDNIEY